MVVVMGDPKNIEQLLNELPGLWKAGALSAVEAQTIETGYDALNTILPGGGWPSNSLMEFVLPSWGVGELSLIMPLIKVLSEKSYWIVWIAPPHIPYAPYLQAQGIDLRRMLVISNKVSDEECLWTMEKLLRTASCGLVLCWPEKISHTAMRRLQLAAEAGKSTGVVFQMRERKTSAAAFRLRLMPNETGLHIEVIKARGGTRHRSVDISL